MKRRTGRLIKYRFLKVLSRLTKRQSPVYPIVADPASPTSISSVTHIKHWEALRLTAYMPTDQDVWTIGYGHTRTAKRGMTITEPEAERLLRVDLGWVQECLARRVTAPVTQEQYDALASFVFNIGGPQFTSSTLLRKLNALDYLGAAQEFMRWNKQRGVVLKGLTRRRASERAMFLRGTNQDV